MNKIILSLYFTLSPLLLLASFDILDYTSSTPDCDGTITVVADGDAGPFTVRLFDISGNIIRETADVDDYVIFEGLCVGMYQVTAINAFECDHYIGDVEIELDQDCNYALEGDEAIAANIIDYDEPTFGNCNGFVSFSLSWINGEIVRMRLYNSGGTLIEQMDYEEVINKFENLCGNQSYTIEVELEDSCLLDLIEFDLDEICAAEDVDLVRITNTMMSTNGQPGYDPNMDNCSGVIELKYIPGYTYEWGNGQTGPVIYNLCRGGYAVTITDQSNNCEDVRYYNVGFEDCSVPQFTSWEVEPSQGQFRPGYVQFTLPAYPLAFHTAELLYNGNVISTKEILPGLRVKFENLTNGTYTLKIMSNCGYHEMEVVVPCMLDLDDNITFTHELVGGSNCEDQERITLNLNGLNPRNYRIEWSNGETSNSIIATSYQSYSVKVSSAFSDCYDEFSISPTLINGIDLVYTNGSCLLLDNGSAIIQVGNWELLNVTFMLNDEPIDLDYSPGDQFLLIDNLAQGRYKLTYNVFGCEYTVSFNIGISKNFEAVPVGVGSVPEEDIIGSPYEPHNFACYYDYTCDGVVYLPNVPRDRVTVDIDGGGNNCKVGLYCDQKYVGEHKFEKKGVSVFEYNQVITAAEEAYRDHPNLTSTYFSSLSTKANMNDACCRLTYCTANFRITSQACRLFGRGPTTGPIVADGEGCIRVACEDPTTPRIRVCPNRDYPRHVQYKGVDIDAQIDDIAGSGCQKTFTYHALQLYYWKLSMEQKYQNDFRNSQLSTRLNFLMSSGQLTACMKITFCYPSFAILYTENPDFPCNVALEELNYDSNCRETPIADANGDISILTACYVKGTVQHGEHKFEETVFAVNGNPRLPLPDFESEEDFKDIENKTSESKKTEVRNFPVETFGKDQDYIIYPNPFENEFNIKVPKNNASYHVEIIDIAGRVVSFSSVINKDLINIHTGNLSSGLYLVKLFDNMALVHSARLIRL